MQEIYENFHEFFYGIRLKLQQEDMYREVVMKLNDTNYSFLELLSNSLKIVKSICIYDVLSVHQVDLIKGLSLELEIRMKNYDENFVIICESSAHAKYLQTKLLKLFQVVK